MLSIRLIIIVATHLFGPGPASDPIHGPPDPTQPICVQNHILGEVAGGQLATLEWLDSGEHGPRRATVLFDPSGEPLQYSEMSTEVPLEAFDRQDSYRLVFLNFLTDFAVVELQGPDGERSQEQRRVEEVLRSADLGNPFETIKLVSSKCAGFTSVRRISGHPPQRARATSLSHAG